jgi:hypothetical protein
MIFVSLGPSFRQRFLSKQLPMYFEDLSSAVELVFEDDFWNSRDSVFVNCFWASSSLHALKMSVAAVELGLLDDFCVRGS